MQRKRHEETGHEHPFDYYILCTADGGFFKTVDCWRISESFGSSCCRYGIHAGRETGPHYGICLRSFAGSFSPGTSTILYQYQNIPSKGMNINLGKYIINIKMKKG